MRSHPTRGHRTPGAIAALLVPAAIVVMIGTCANQLSEPPLQRPTLPANAAQVDAYRARVFAALQQVMGPLPGPDHRVPLDVRIVRVDTLERVTRTLLTFAAEQGDRVPGCLMVPRRLSGPAPAVLCLHEVTPLGYEEPAGMRGAPQMAYARELAERGFVTLATDYPNYGRYRCDPYALGYVSTTMKGVWNRERAVDLLASLPQVDPERIACLGHSLGGHNALFSAAFDPRIRGVVCSCGITSIEAYANGHLDAWSDPQYMPRIATLCENDARQMPFGFRDVLAVLAPRPVMVIAAERDVLFPLAGVREVVDRASSVYAALGAAGALRLLVVPGYHAFPDTARREAYAWLERVLDRAPRSGPPRPRSSSGRSDI